MFRSCPPVPKFGKIQGLEDMNGTFFFITK